MKRDLQILNRIVFVFIAFLLLFSELNADIEKKMSDARILYYKSIKEEDYLEKAYSAFESIKKSNPSMKGVATTYMGSLIMLKGKYAFWPNKKLEYVEDGIKVMDEGLASDPENLESLFIYGSSCHYLPFFLGKKSLAKTKLKKFLQVLPNSDISRYDRTILKNAINFILEKIELTNEEKNRANEYLKKLG